MTAFNGSVLNIDRKGKIVFPAPFARYHFAQNDTVQSILHSDSRYCCIERFNTCNLSNAYQTTH